MFLKLAVWMGLGVYALLSATDWFLTFTLLRSAPTAIEANPLAAACLEQYGWDGLALYKFGGVVVVLGAVVLIARRRPAVAAGVLALGCSVLLSVAVYTHGLIRENDRDAREQAENAAWPAPTRNAASRRADRGWFAPDTVKPVPIVTAKARD
jgi:hypothetical protein